MKADLKILSSEGRSQFQSLQTDAANSVAERFHRTHGSAYARFGHGGREAWREDLAFLLEFLRPVLEFGLLQPMVDYLSWLASVLIARAIPPEHLALSLDWLAEFFAERMNSTESGVVVTALEASRTQFLQAGATQLATLESHDPWPEAAVFETILLAGNQFEALAIVNRCIDAGRRLIEVEMHVIQPALYQIGEKWQANQVSVAQEHLATAIAQSVMTMGLLRSRLAASIDKRVLLACVEGNQHAVGLRMVADAFLLAGWDVQYLGANMPTHALLSQVAEWRPDLVGLSVSFPQQMCVVKSVIEGLAKQFGSARPAMMIGGLAINRFHRLADLVGADAHDAEASAAPIDASRFARV